ncbi:uncharacterized protein EI90DRAFT_1028994 [Cantharellus anzutake]|uniref:uncharacterized protein n=1 Tax=Cantharellus anzutake TaxID=1750568 RepID=UPI00190885B5|nr:uncharacterized protein EI90DRAFT_1028994 [Cantharellus anzutake]KAF8331511.1 hypothetical protein EI90DRAFT_1028994 [Cantharellus anzutake]
MMSSLRSPHLASLHLHLCYSISLLTNRLTISPPSLVSFKYFCYFDLILFHDGLATISSKSFSFFFFFVFPSLIHAYINVTPRTTYINVQMHSIQSCITLMQHSATPKKTKQKTKTRIKSSFCTFLTPSQKYTYILYPFFSPVFSSQSMSSPHFPPPPPFLTHFPS